MKTPAIQFVRIPSEDKSIVEVDILRHGKSVGSIRAERHETHRAMNGNATYCTGSWHVSFLDEKGDDIESDDFDVRVVGFRPSRHWNVPAKAGTPADVSRALAEAKAAATAWLKDHPDHR